LLIPLADQSFVVLTTTILHLIINSLDHHVGHLEAILAVRGDRRTIGRPVSRGRRKTFNRDDPVPIGLSGERARSGVNLVRHLAEKDGRLPKSLEGAAFALRLPLLKVLSSSALDIYLLVGVSPAIEPLLVEERRHEVRDLHVVQFLIREVSVAVDPYVGEVYE
jgi:hypothetical protein